jgi:hypothetical protein
MSYVIIPVQPNPNQAFSCVLDGQRAQIALTTTDDGLLADVTYQGLPVASARLCLDRTSINPNPYAGLEQFLGFVDTQGASDPTFDGFGTRFLLIYGTPPPTYVSTPTIPSGGGGFPTHGWGVNYGGNFGGN